MTSYTANCIKGRLIFDSPRLKRLLCLQDVSSSELGDIKAIAVSAVSEFIGSGDVFHFDLHTSPAVKQLEKDEQYAPIYQLLMLLLNGNVQVNFSISVDCYTLLSRTSVKTLFER